MEYALLSMQKESKKIHLSVYVTLGGGDGGGPSTMPSDSTWEIYNSAKRALYTKWEDSFRDGAERVVNGAELEI